MPLKNSLNPRKHYASINRFPYRIVEEIMSMIEIWAQPDPQHQFLESTADIVLYGRTTGSGKSFCKLMNAPGLITVLLLAMSMSMALRNQTLHFDCCMNLTAGTEQSSSLMILNLILQLSSSKNKSLRLAWGMMLGKKNGYLIIKRLKISFNISAGY